MKKTWIFLVIVFFLLAFVVIVLLNLNALVRKNKDRLIERVEDSTGRDISVRDVGISIWGGLGIRLEGFSVSENPAFSSGTFVDAEALEVHLALWPLLRKRLQVESATLVSPTIRIIRDVGGRFNFGSFAGAERGKDSSEGKAPPALGVALADIEDGRVVYSDARDGIEITIERIDSHVEGFAPDRPVDIDIRASLFSQRKNVILKGRMKPSGSLSPAGMEGAIDIEIDDLDAGLMRRSLGNAASALPADMDAEGLVDISARVELSGGEISVEGSFHSPSGRVGKIDYSSLEGSFDVKNGSVSIEGFSLESMGGKAEGSLSLRIASGSPTFSLDSRLEGVDLSALASSLFRNLPVPLKGDINLDMELSGSGTGREGLVRSLGGKGIASMAKGRLEGFNITSSLMKSLSGYPGVSSALSKRLEEKYPPLFRSRDTDFRSWESDFVIERGKLLVRNLVLHASQFTLKGNGFVGLDKTMRMDLTLVASKQLGEDLVREVSLLGLLRNAEGNVAIPLIASGTFPKVRVIPDERAVEKILKKSFIEKGLEKMKKRGLEGLIPIPQR